jgi:hypothetical protein
MKLNKKVGLIVIIVVIVAALASLSTIYFRQAGERGELNERLSRTEILLPNLMKQKKDLQDQLAQAQSSIDSSGARFPESIGSIEYGEYIFGIADRCGLTLASLSFPKPSAKTEGSVTYSVVSLSLPVSGALADIFEFIDIIRTDARFASTQVKSVNLDVAGGRATINVDIYGYKGT